MIPAAITYRPLPWRSEIPLLAASPGRKQRTARHLSPTSTFLRPTTKRALGILAVLLVGHTLSNWQDPPRNQTKHLNNFSLDLSQPVRPVLR